MPVGSITAVVVTSSNPRANTTLFGAAVTSSNLLAEISQRQTAALFATIYLAAESIYGSRTLMADYFDV
jgi:hypothetical protein